MSTFIKGDAVILSIYSDTDTDYLPIGCLTSNSLSITRNVIEAQTKCSPGRVVRYGGSTSSEISFEATYIKTEAEKTNFDALLDFINESNGVRQFWRMSTDQTSPVAYYGTGILTDLEITAAAGDEFATFSGTIQNSGLITEVDPK
jgi:predicted secreted protein